jgi:hypothetical protein
MKFNLILLALLVFNNNQIYYTAKIDKSLKVILQDTLMRIFLNELSIKEPKFKIANKSSYWGPHQYIKKINWKYLIDTVTNKTFTERYKTFYNNEIDRRNNYISANIELNKLPYHSEKSMINCDYDFLNDSIIFVYFELPFELIPKKYNQHQEYGYLINNGFGYYLLSCKDTTVILEAIFSQ